MPDIENDIGHAETEKMLLRIEAEIKREYARAASEMQEKLDDYLSRFKTKDEIWAKAVSEGKKTKEEYQRWRTGQILVGKRWQEQLEVLSRDAANADKKAMSIVKGYMPEAYAIGHNYGTFQAEHGGRVDTSYTLYNRAAVERLWREDPQLLPDPAPDGTTAQKLRENKDLRWNRKHIQSEITQAILQGERITAISDRLQTVTDMDRKAAMRNARTMMTSAENAGRNDSFKRAASMGIDLTIEWSSTLDTRTRVSHRRLDGMRRDIGEPFEFDDEIVGHVVIEYPGDLGGKEYKVPPHMIYNCRCTLIAWVKGFEPSEQVTYSPKMGELSYEEWKQGKKVTSNPIELPYRKEAAIKGSYIAKYREMAGNTGGAGGKRVDKFGNGGIMKSNTSDTSHDIPITNEKIESVPYIDIKGFTHEQNIALQNSLKDILRVVKDLPLGTEAGAIYCIEDGDFKRVGDIIVGEHGEHHVSLPDYNKPYIAVHNHPDGKTLSPDDINRMLINPNNMGIVAVGNNASVYVFQATNNPEIISFSKFMEKQVDGIKSGLSYEDFSKEIENIWKAGGDYGFIYTNIQNDKG